MNGTAVEFAPAAPWTRVLYNLLFPIFFVIALPRYAWRMIRRGKSGRGFGQRFGAFSGKSRSSVAAASGGIWIHAVSVGEVNLAALLIREWRERDPGTPIILSCTTVTGQAVAQARLPEDVPIIYNPLDFPPCVRSTLDLLRPRALVLVEAEMWPNLFWECRRRALPIVLVNARLSPTSEGRFRQFRWFIAPLLRQLRCLCVQNERDRSRFIDLGAAPSQTVCTGSMKYDVSQISETHGFDAGAILRQAGWDEGQPIFLAGSTFRGEERLAAKVFLELQREFPDLFLVIAPRHFERAGEVSAALKGLGLDPKRRSKLKSPRYEKNRVLILDSTGELRHFYPLATVVFIGKSISSKGGQNFLEPVQAGRPVVFGPHMENFAVQAEEFVAAQAVVQIASGAELREAVAQFLRDPERARVVAERALRLFESNLGATRRTVDAILPWTHPG